jgi:hypothetical protein
MGSRSPDPLEDCLHVQVPKRISLGRSCGSDLPLSFASVRPARPSERAGSGGVEGAQAKLESEIPPPPAVPSMFATGARMRSGRAPVKTHIMVATLPAVLAVAGTFFAAVIVAWLTY